MEKGWVKSHRQILDNIFLMKDNNAFLVFTKLMLMVNRNGEIAIGRNSLSEQININARTLYDVLIRLEKQGMLNIKSNNRYSVISICNWAKYQESPTTEPTSTQQPANNQPTTSQHYNKNKEVRKKNKNNSTELAMPLEFGNPDINRMFDYWQEQIGYAVTAKRQANRNACSNLIKKHKVEGVSTLIRAVAASHEDRYSGVQISDFVDLQANLNKLMAWGRKKAVATDGEKGLILT